MPKHTSPFRPVCDVTNVVVFKSWSAACSYVAVSFLLTEICNKVTPWRMAFLEHLIIIQKSTNS